MTRMHAVDDDSSVVKDFFHTVRHVLSVGCSKYNCLSDSTEMRVRQYYLFLILSSLHLLVEAPASHELSVFES